MNIDARRVNYAFRALFVYDVVSLRRTCYLDLAYLIDDYGKNLFGDAFSLVGLECFLPTRPGVDAYRREGDTAFRV